MNMPHSLRLILLYVLTLMPFVATSAPAMPEPTVTFHVPKKVSVGLPIAVKVEVKNNTSQLLTVLMPQDIYTLSYELYRDGKPFERNVQYAIAWQPDWGRELSPGEKVQGTCALDRYFHPSLPVGDYTAQIRYVYQKSPRREILSSTFHFSVIEPTQKKEIRAKELFLKGRDLEYRTYLSQEGIKAFAELIRRYPRSEYARNGARKKAFMHRQKKEYEQAIKSFHFYFAHQSRNRDNFDSPYFKFYLADTYYRQRNSTTARNIIEKLLASSESSPGMKSMCEKFLKRIDEELRVNAIF